VALKDCVAPALTVAELGEMEIVTAPGWDAEELFAAPGEVLPQPMGRRTQRNRTGAGSCRKQDLLG
jgi:hypothetical protein